MKHLYLIVLCSFIFSTHLTAQNRTSSSGKQVFHKQEPNNSQSLKSTLITQSGNGRAPGRSLSNRSFQPNTIFSFENATTPAVRNCFTVESEKKLQEKFPGRLSTAAFEEKLSSRMIASARMNTDEEIVYKIPTIVHVIHHGEPLGLGSNISQEQVLSQFDVLNEDFRRIGGGHNEHPSGADIRIEFVPVLVDPQGNLLEEPGIDRVFGYSAYYQYDNIEFELKPNTQWDPDRYFNIWVLRFGGSYANVLGYAQFPSFSGLEGLPDMDWANTDGIVIGFQYFGRTGNVVSPFDKGRTTTHEAGHWLGLRHIWGDGDCSVDDFCADTPNANGPNTSCQFRDSCPEEGADMIENYMDYSTDGCMNIFTNDQKLRIRTVMEMSPRRNTLVACQVAPVASPGINVADKIFTWSQYTATQDEVVTISSFGITDIDTRLSIYRECNALPVNVSDDFRQTEQSALTVSLMAGETLKICWQNKTMGEPFEWTLSTSAPTAGNACGLAIRAVEGLNQLPDSIGVPRWFKYTSTGNQKVIVDGTGKSFDVYGNSCDQLVLHSSGQTSAVVYDLAEGESIFISFAETGEDNSWSLSTEPLRNHETCADAQEAIVGENVIPFASPFEFWYSYTMPETGEVVIGPSASEPLSGDVRLTIFKGCDGPLLDETTTVSEAPLVVRVGEGEIVRIRWRSASGLAHLAWNLESRPFQNGEICSVAIEAAKGINHTQGTPQWFRYTTQQACNLKISSVGFTDADTHVIVKRACDGPITEDSDNAFIGNDFYHQAELIMYGIHPGEEFYILWSDKWSYDGFDFVIEEVAPQAGDHCTFAKRATVGTNIVDYSDHQNFGNIFWNRFTVPANGKRITAFAHKPIDMAIYINYGCEGFVWVDSDQGQSSAVGLAAGTELVIIWDGADYDEDFTWELSVTDIAPGDRCYTPIHAVQGINTSPRSPVWYDYTMSQDGSLKLNYEGPSGFIPYVAILDGCPENANILSQNNNTAFVSGLNEGDHVYIYWTPGYPFGPVRWSLEEMPEKQGDTCADPIIASYGLNHSEYATQWFRYTAEATGRLKISSRAFTFTNTDLYVYDACGGTLLGESDDIFVYEDFVLYFQSELILDHVEAGQEILIKWAGTYSFEPFTWEITNDGPRTGDSCEDPLPASEGVNNGMKPTPAWFSFTMPQTGSLTLSSLGYTDTNTNVEVYDGCNGNLIAANDDYSGDPQSFLHIEELPEGQTVLIRWSNLLASEQYTFDWKLFVGGPQPGLVCELPATAQEGLNTTPAYTSIFFWYNFTMPADNKKLLIRKLTPGGAYYRSVGVTSGCDRMMDYGIGEDSVVVTGLAAGETISIFWGQLMLGERPSFDWELIVSDYEQGDGCETPAAAVRGVQHASGAETWYSFTLGFDADVRITSVDLNSTYTNTMVEIYEACGGDLVASNDNPDDWSSLLAEVFLEDRVAGEAFLVKWMTALPFQVPFEWELAFENPDNNAPTLGEAFFEIPSGLSNGLVIGTLSGADPDNDALHYNILSGNDDAAFALHEITGELSVAHAGNVSSTGGRVLEVSVSDNFSSATATVHVDLVTSVEADDDAPIAVYPNPATDKLTLSLPAGLQVYVIQLTDINGRTVRTFESTKHELSLDHIQKGMYVLELTTDRGQVKKKIVVL